MASAADRRRRRGARSRCGTTRPTNPMGPVRATVAAARIEPAMYPSKERASRCAPRVAAQASPTARRFHWRACRMTTSAGSEDERM